MEKRTLKLLVILVAVLLSASVIYQFLEKRTPAASNPPPIPPAPPTVMPPQESEQDVLKATDLEFTDMDGNVKTLADFVGKPIVVNFWTSWCGYCKKEMPDFQALYEELGDEVQFVMLQATDPRGGETREKGAAFIKENGYTFPVYFDDQNYQMVYGFGVTSYPQTFFFDSKGEPVVYQSGMITAEKLRMGIKMAQDKSAEYQDTGVAVMQTAAEPTLTAEEAALVNPSWCTMPAAYQKIDAKSAKNFMAEFAGEEQGFYLVDVRTEEEYKAGHIEGAMLVPNDQIAAKAAELFPDTKSVILLYCRSGNRSEQAAKALVDLGYNHVYDFGGINDWPYETVKG